MLAGISNEVFNKEHLVSIIFALLVHKELPGVGDGEVELSMIAGLNNELVLHGAWAKLKSKSLDHTLPLRNIS